MHQVVDDIHSNAPHHLECSRRQANISAGFEGAIATAREEVRVVRETRVLFADLKEQISQKNLLHLLNKVNVFLLIRSPHSTGIL